MNLSRTVITSVLACVTSITASAMSTTKEDIDSIYKDLKIMTGMLQTALAPESPAALRVKISSQYFASQGVVFKIRTSGANVGRYFMGDGDFNMQIGHFVEGVMDEVQSSLDHSGVHISLPVTPDIPSVPAVSLHDSDLEEVIEMQLEDHEHSFGGHGRHGDALSDKLREMQRAHRNDRREFERAMRNYERHMDEQRDQHDSADNSAIQIKREAARKEFENAQTAYKQKKSTYSEEIKKIAADKEQQRQQKLSDLSNRTLEALCRYGSPLRNIEDAGYITVVFENVVSEQEGRSDLYHVFGRKDVSDCLNDKLSAKQLMSKATTYSF